MLEWLSTPMARHSGSSARMCLTVPHIEPPEPTGPTMQSICPRHSRKYSATALYARGLSGFEYCHGQKAASRSAMISSSRASRAAWYPPATRPSAAETRSTTAPRSVSLR